MNAKAIGRQLAAGEAPLEVVVAAWCAWRSVELGRRYSRADLSRELGFRSSTAVSCALADPVRNPGTIGKIRARIEESA